MSGFSMILPVNLTGAATSGVFYPITLSALYGVSQSSMLMVTNGHANLYITHENVWGLGCRMGFRSLFQLDLQVDFLRTQSLLQMGKWLARKSISCQEKEAIATAALNESPYTVDALQEHWAAQVCSQTQPLPRASTTLAKSSIKAILDMKDYVKALQVETGKVDSLLGKGEGDIDELLSSRLELVSKKEEVEAQIIRKQQELGVSDAADLRKLLNNKYLQVCMQAKALKTWIQAKLRNRKFELERLNRVYHQASASERRLKNHVEGQFSRSQPNLLDLVKSYNSLCVEIEKLIGSHHAPPHAVAPKQLEREGLFSLDVDDAIWDDHGLDDHTQEIPLWLGNQQVKDGIKAFLMKSRCEEEQQYLQREVEGLVKWFMEEWNLIEVSLNYTGDEDLLYHLERQRTEFLNLGSTWRKHLNQPKVNLDIPATWGPTDEEFNSQAQKTGNVAADSESDSGLSDISVDGLADDLLQVFESLPLTIDDGTGLGDGSDDLFYSGMQGSPKKRACHLSDM
ncbi:hypothetical protein H1R20_g659, partial [Candolleomyces eurysporus]